MTTLEDDIRKFSAEMKILLMSDAEKEKYMRTDPVFLALQAKTEERHREIAYQASGEADYDRTRALWDQMGLNKEQALQCIKEANAKKRERASQVQMSQSTRSKPAYSHSESDILKMYRAMGMSESEARETYRSVSRA